MKSDQVIGLLADVIPGLIAVSPDTTGQMWKFEPIAQSRARATVRVGAHWISFEAKLSQDRDTDALRTLQMQSALQGGIKRVALRMGCGLRAEIPLLVETATARDWLRRHAAIVYAGLRAALGQTKGTFKFTEHNAIAFDPVVLAERCTAGGWRATVPTETEVRVEFGSRSAHRVVYLRQHGNAIRAAVTLDTGMLAEQGPDSQLALAVFLLRATRSLQWVRAFTTGSHDTLTAAGFECIFAPSGDDDPIIVAIDALATACELYACEAETLAQSAALAQHYLSFDEDFSVRSSTSIARVPSGSAPTTGAVPAIAVA